jgi:hypothetical protein
LVAAHRMILVSVGWTGGSGAVPAAMPGAGFNHGSGFHRGSVPRMRIGKRKVA